MLESVWSVIQVIIGFGFIIFVHELGHFFFAKKVGIRVEKFSIGFGPRIWGFTRGDTEYRLAIIPLGGYVKMAGENPDERPKGEDPDGPPPEPKGDEYFSKPVGARAQVIVAGSLMNFLIAFPLCIVFYLIGFDAAEPYVGRVRPGSAAYEAGLQFRDKIIAVNGKTIRPRRGWRDITPAILLEKTDDNTTTFVVQRGEEEKTIVVHYPASVGLGRARVRELGIYPSPYTPDPTLRLIRNGGPADGILKPDDRVLSVNGKAVRYWEDLRRAISRGGDKPLKMLVLRGSEEIEVEVQPKPHSELSPNLFVLDVHVHNTTTIGFVRKSFPAEGKLRVGNTITHVNGQAVQNWQEMFDHVSATDKEVAFTVDGVPEPIVIAQVDGPLISDSIGIAPTGRLFVSEDAAGGKIQRGDELVEVQEKPIGLWEPKSRQSMGQPIFWPEDLHQAALYGEKDDTLAMTFARGDDSFQVEMGYAPLQQPRLAIEPYSLIQTVHPGFFTAVKWGLSEPLSMIELTGKSFAMLFTTAGAQKELSGPIGILSMSYNQARNAGLSHFLWLLAFISINLSIINMLPIPVLDGGHMLFLILEKLKGKPISEKVMIRAQFVGLMLLVGLMLFASFNDVADFLTG